MTGLLAVLAAACSGGIDFTAPELQTVLPRPLRPGERPVEPLAGAPLVDTSHGPVLDLSASPEEDQEAFLLWLGADASTFWVNLNPNEPHRVIHAQFGRTRAGRTLLEADLLMKVHVASLVHPDSAPGAAFWSALYSRVSPAAKKLCLSFRTWLVPQHGAVMEAGGRALLLNASLGVMLEAEYVQQGRGHKAAASHVFAGCDDDAVRDGLLATRIYQQALLPVLAREINTHPQYEPLRRQLYCRVLAQWLLARNPSWRDAYGELRAAQGQASGALARVALRPASDGTAVAVDPGLYAYSGRRPQRAVGYADSGGTPATAAIQPEDRGASDWHPQTTFDAYAASFSQGEFNVTRYVQVGDLAYAKVFFYGAIDFRSTDPHPVVMSPHGTSV